MCVYKKRSLRRDAILNLFYLLVNSTILWHKYIYTDEN